MQEKPTFEFVFDNPQCKSVEDIDVFMSVNHRKNQSTDFTKQFDPLENYYIDSRKEDEGDGWGGMDFQELFWYFGKPKSKGVIADQFAKEVFIFGVMVKNLIAENRIQVKVKNTPDNEKSAKKLVGLISEYIDVLITKADEVESVYKHSTVMRILSEDGTAEEVFGKIISAGTNSEFLRNLVGEVSGLFWVDESMQIIEFLEKYKNFSKDESILLNQIKEISEVLVEKRDSKQEKLKAYKKK